MKKYSFSEKSEQNLSSLHPDMVRVLRRAMAMNIMDFSVNETMRTLEKQKLIGAYVFLTSLICMLGGLYFNVYMVLTYIFYLASLIMYFNPKIKFKFS